MAGDAFTTGAGLSRHQLPIGVIDYVLSRMMKDARPDSSHPSFRTLLDDYVADWAAKQPHHAIQTDVLDEGSLETHVLLPNSGHVVSSPSSMEQPETSDSSFGTQHVQTPVQRSLPSSSTSGSGAIGKHTNHMIIRIVAYCSTGCNS